MINDKYIHYIGYSKTLQYGNGFKNGKLMAVYLWFILLSPVALLLCEALVFLWRSIACGWVHTLKIHPHFHSAENLQNHTGNICDNPYV